MAQEGFQVTPVDTTGDPCVDDATDAIRVNVVAGGGAGGGTSSPFDAAFPAAGTAMGAKSTDGLMKAVNVDSAGLLKVNVAAGAAGGGVAQIQARSTANVWTDVGFAAGNLYLPVIGSFSTAVIGHVIIDSATIAALTDGTQITQVSTLPTLILSTSTASIGHVAVDSLPALVLSTSTAAIGNITSIVNSLPAGTNVIGHAIIDTGSTAHVTVDAMPAIILSTSTATIGHVIMDAGSTATVAVSSLPTLILSTSTASIGHVIMDAGSTANVAVTSLPTLILSTSTASIGHVILDAGSTANVSITNASIPVTQFSTPWSVVLSTSTAHVAVDSLPTLVLSASTSIIGTVEITDGTNIMTLSTQGSATITGLIGNTPMAITGDNRPSWVSDVMEPLSQTLGGRLRVYQMENERLIRSVETQSLLDHGDRQYSKDYRSPGFMSDRAYSR